MAVVLNPIIPSLGHIIGGLCPGKIIKIHGRSTPTAERFNVNLQCGPEGDIALHVSVRFSQNTVVRNTFQYNNWGIEEAYGGFPFKKGQTFEIVIICMLEEFKIAVNGQYFTEFIHRIPFHRITHIGIEGDVMVTYLQYEEGNASINTPVINPIIPFLGSIFGSLYPEKLIKIHGTPFPTAERFNVNVLCEPKGDIALHISVRFSENTVVRNTFHCNQWGSEERCGGFPFKKGQSFEIVILCTPEVFKIAVNGQHFTEFTHRIPFHRATHLGIERDVMVTYLQCEEGNASINTPVINPVIPFLGSIFGSIYPGKLIRIQGISCSTAERFNVNVLCGPKGDITLHISVRFPQNTVVRNTLQGNKWGPEESCGGFPFKKGQPFEIVILCTPEAFKIAVNGKHFTEFIHRIPYYRGTHLGIEGDVMVTHLQCEEGNALINSPVINPVIPFLGSIFGSIQPGKLIRIHGTPCPTAERFDVNVQCEPKGDITLHISVRFPHNTVVCNSFQYNKWGPEERCVGFPFKKGQSFEIMILCTPEAFKIAVNGKHFTEFIHRIPYYHGTHLGINGDVMVAYLKYEDGNATINPV